MKPVPLCLLLLVGACTPFKPGGDRRDIQGRLAGHFVSVNIEGKSQRYELSGHLSFGAGIRGQKGGLSIEGVLR